MYDLSQATFDVIIPVFNEQDSVCEICNRVNASILRGRIIVVDDGSTDGTWDKVAELASRRNVCGLRHTCNRGKGAAIRTGLQHVTSRYVLIQDADLEYDPNDYAKLLAPLLENRADVVYGSRYAGQSILQKVLVEGVDAGIGLLAVRVLNLAVRAIYGLRITDEATCYKVFNTNDLRLMQLQSERFEFCPEVTAKVARLGLRLVEVPISYHRRSKSEGKKIRWRDGWTAIKTLWRWRRWESPSLSRQVPGPKLTSVVRREA